MRYRRRNGQPVPSVAILSYRTESVLAVAITEGDK